MVHPTLNYGDVLQSIFQFLPSEDLLRIIQVNKKFRDVGMNPKYPGWESYTMTRKSPHGLITSEIFAK